jgi:hypothetical protein
MKSLILNLLLLILMVTPKAFTQTNVCQGSFTFGSGPCQRIIIGNGTPGQIRVCLNTAIPTNSGGNNCNPGGVCNPPYNGGGWQTRISIWTSDGVAHTGSASVQNWFNTPVGTCFTLPSTNGYATIFGLCNLSGVTISWTTIDACGQNACLGLPCSPLPVELISFDGIRTPNGNLLIWKTYTEYNSDYYLIEHSTNGEFDENSVIGRVGAAGNSSEVFAYTYTDSTPPQSINYYKLIQVDINGDYQEYGPISVDNRKLLKVIYLTDMLGRKVREDSKGFLFEIYEDGTTKMVFR